MSDEMDEIWELYADDGAQALDAMEMALEALQAGDGDQAEHIGALFRAVHTFKGNSRVLGLSTVESRAHLSEDLIGLVRDEGAELTEEIIDVLIESGDILRGMLDETAVSRADVAPEPSEHLMDRLRAVIAVCKGEEPSAAAASDAPAEEKAKESDEAAPEAEAEPETEDSPKEDAPAAVNPADNPMFAAMASLDDLPDPTGDRDDDDFFDDDHGDRSEEELAEPEPAPEPEPEPEPAPEPEKTEAAAEDAGGEEAGSGLTRLLDDPVYLKIFTDMVVSTIDDLSLIRDVADGEELPEGAFPKASSLCYACEQLDLTEWVETLQAFEAKKSEGGTLSDLGGLIESLQKLKAADLGGDEPEPEPEAEAADSAPAGSNDTLVSLINDLEEVFEDINQLTARMEAGQAVEAQEFNDLSDKAVKVVTPYEFIRVTEAAMGFADSHKLKDFRSVELKFYEELASVESVLDKGGLPEDLMLPSQRLKNWCSEHIFDTLRDLRIGLDSGHKGSGSTWFPEFEQLMRRAFNASAYYEIETASQLTMALVDLFARTRVSSQSPDVILIQMARGFVDTMELVFDALTQGDTPDIAKIEALFEEAANVSFLASGVVTARSIEQKLGLPKEFHRVLSPESVKSAQSCIDNGLHFFILTCDLNEDDKLAENFLDWISSGKAKMITNVTVFVDDKTIFDFLIAAPMTEDIVAEAVSHLDPSGKKLTLKMALEVVEEAAPVAAAETAASAEDAQIFASGAMTENLKLLEAVGEISAAQSMIGAMLHKASTRDLLYDVQTKMAEAGLPELPLRARGVLRGVFEEYLTEIQAINEAEAQLSSQLSQLQEESVSMRSRPAEVILRPMQTFVSTEARKLGSSAQFSYVGGECSLDQLVLEEVRGLLKLAISDRLRAKEPPSKFFLAIDREEDRVRVEITDNGKECALSDDFKAASHELTRRKGVMRFVTLPNGGVRLMLEVPLHTIVLEGMVVKIGDVRYVLPIESIQRIHQGSKTVPIKAAGNRRMLVVDDNDYVPIRVLSSARTQVHSSGQQLYVIVRNNASRMAIPVDELLGQQLVLLRPLRGVLSMVPDVTGVAILSGGEIGMVVSVSRIEAAA